MRLGALIALFFSVAAPAEAAEPVQVMVLGTYHMGNPGQDLANVQADDVTTPGRQAELAAVAAAIERWRPTKVLVEAQRPAPFAVEQYRAFTPAMLASNRNETWQIGFRIARDLGHADVYGFDEQPGPGEPDYFPFDKVEAFAKAHGRTAEVESTLAFFQERAAAEEKLQPKLSVAELLMRHNDPAAAREDHRRGYYGMLGIGDADDQAGAELNAYWYMRNAKMFAKIGLIAAPGDRLLVLVGSGHGYWLRHFASETPGFVSVDPMPYLKQAAMRR